MTTLNYTIEELKVWTVKRQLSDEILVQLTENNSNLELLLKELEPLVIDYTTNEIVGIEHFYTLFDGLMFLSGLDLYDQLNKHIKINTSLEKNYDETDTESENNLINEGWLNLNEVDVYLWSYRIDIEIPKDLLDMLNINNQLVQVALENLASDFNYSIYLNGVAFESY